MKKLYPYLAYAGTLPFIACAACLVFHKLQLPGLGSVEQILSVYTLVIASFMSGAHWGQHLHLDGTWGRVLPLLSNFLAITLWLAFLLFAFKTLLVIFVGTFLILLLIDYSLYKEELITSQYFQIRCYATAIVVISLIISKIAS